jgi:hypothetical protein
MVAEIILRAPEFHQQGPGHLQCHVADEENAGSRSKDAVAESQLAGHSDRGIGHAGAVDVICDVEEEKKWQQPQTNAPAGAVRKLVRGRCNRA